MKLVLVASVATVSAFPTLTYVNKDVETNPTHYGDPAGDCMDDEVAIQIQDVDGAVCTPKCTGILKTKCPKDVPDGVTATPQCALQDTSSNKYCALICSPSTEEKALRAGDTQCGDAKCRAISGVGICTYDTSEKSSLDETAKAVNEANTSWKAEAPAQFETADDAAKLCGTFLSDHPDYVKLPPKPKGLLGQIHFTAPDSFDARTQWPKCTVISNVRDQSSCGSCWAFGSTEAFESRHCIATGEDKEFSAYDTAANCKGFSCGMSMGCGGGQPSSALSWMSKKGVVTGMDFDDVGKGGSCLPYEFAPCAHHVPATKDYPQCPTSEYSTKSTTDCDSAYTTNKYSDDKVKAKNAYSINGVDELKKELATNGPVSAAFTVYDDFPTYKSGVYKPTSSKMLGGHAILIVGYGTEDGEDYWLVKNSWNAEWGDGGFFKIAHGACGIENDLTGVEF